MTNVGIEGKIVQGNSENSCVEVEVTNLKSGYYLNANTSQNNLAKVIKCIITTTTEAYDVKREDITTAICVGKAYATTCTTETVGQIMDGGKFCARNGLVLSMIEGTHIIQSEITSENTNNAFPGATVSAEDGYVIVNIDFKSITYTGKK